MRTYHFYSLQTARLSAGRQTERACKIELFRRNLHTSINDVTHVNECRIMPNGHFHNLDNTITTSDASNNERVKVKVQLVEISFKNELPQS